MSQREPVTIRARNDSGVSVHHALLTGSWTADVEEMEASIEGLSAVQRSTNKCQVVFFEIAGDAQLHVNVTHRHATRSVSGWAGPARMPDGFLHNRTFDGVQPRQIVKHIREMILARAM